MRNAALFALAAAFALMAVALFRIGAQLPALNDNLERITTLGDAITAEVPAVVDMANRYEPHIDPLLAEVAASRDVADKALTEAAAYRDELPAILTRLDAMDQQLSALRTEMPEILSRVDGALDESRAWRPVGEQALSESEAWRPVSAQALTEAEAWRGSIPGYLDRSEALVANAREAGKEASAGMVSGFFSGALSLPFEALGNVGALVDPRSLSAKHMTQEDQDNLRTAAIALLQEPAQKVANWSSAGSGHAGTVEITDSRTTRKGLCHSLSITNQFTDNKSETLKRQICQGEDGKWTVKK